MPRKHVYSKTPFETRFWRQVNRLGPTECWNWTGDCANKRYGRIMNLRKDRPAHRVAYELTHGEIPTGLHCLHRCDNPRCCNPAHLWLGTAGDNMRDCIAKGRNNPSKGEHRYNAKLSDSIVREARTAWDNGESLNKLARRFGVEKSTMWTALVGKSWNHVGRK